MGMKNDMSFIIVEVLNLYEHQASFNTNMPVRGFLYFGDLYRAYIERYKLNLYSSQLIKLPLPQYPVFYNGLKDESVGAAAVRCFCKADEAIEYCIHEGVLSELLSLHRAEVRNMILEEYDEQSHMASKRQEWREIGREEGRTIGISKGLANAVLELLNALGEVSDSLRDRILQEENHDILKKWLRLASESDTVETFREQME